jgi:hypothetical protein
LTGPGREVWIAFVGFASSQRRIEPVIASEAKQSSAIAKLSGMIEAIVRDGI